MEPSRRWGDDRAILDDEEARRRILEAAGRCIVRRGNTQFRMGEVADEAGVSRSTVYRYFPGRDDVLLGLMLRRVDHALAESVRSLPAPEDPVRSVPQMVLARVESVDGNPLNEALFAAESTAMASALQKGSEPLVELLLRHYGPLLERWKAAGLLYPDVDFGPSCSGCTPRRCSCWRPPGDIGRTPTSAGSSSSSWCGPWCHRSDNNRILSDVQTFEWFSSRTPVFSTQHRNRSANQDGWT
ncbi:bacterial regulatory s, tetR family protein [Mycobacterium avium subsp. avium 2285 (R)]|nr:bacterial regulatory s, tetR family protein [Mycobacterium avium subsp. avium 2285 (R)]